MDLRIVGVGHKVHGLARQRFAVALREERVGAAPDRDAASLQRLPHGQKHLDWNDLDMLLKNSDPADRFAVLQDPVRCRGKLGFPIGGKEQRQLQGRAKALRLRQDLVPLRVQPAEVPFIAQVRQMERRDQRKLPRRQGRADDAAECGRLKLLLQELRQLRCSLPGCCSGSFRLRARNPDGHTLLHGIAGTDLHRERQPERRTIGLEGGVRPVALVLHLEYIAREQRLYTDLVRKRVFNGADIQKRLVRRDMHRECPQLVLCMAVGDPAALTRAGIRMQHAEADAVAQKLRLRET